VRGGAVIDPRLTGAFSADPLPAPLEAALPGEVFLAALPRRRGRSRDDELLPRGTIIDKYCLDGVLGRGGFAIVYRATHLLLGSTVAIKLIRPRVLARQPGLAELLCQEARFAARLDHPNVVRVHDVTHNDRITYVVMEYIEGRSLAEAIQAQGALPPAEVVRVGLAVTAGLRAGLAQGLIHRDIKPANILLGNDGGVKIVDLGLAHTSAPDERVAALGKPSVVGTHGYMSPEQAQDPERVDFRADIHALGVTLYEAATGQLPPGPALPAELAPLVAGMMSRRPEDRPSSYESLEAALRRTLDDLAGKTPRRMDP
jgi:serine/threonine protein kinase